MQMAHFKTHSQKHKTSNKKLLVGSPGLTSLTTRSTVTLRVPGLLASRRRTERASLHPIRVRSLLGTQLADASGAWRASAGQPLGLMFPRLININGILVCQKKEHTKTFVFQRMESLSLTRIPQKTHLCTQKLHMSSWTSQVLLSAWTSFPLR